MQLDAHQIIKVQQLVKKLQKKLENKLKLSKTFESNFVTLTS